MKTFTFNWSPETYRLWGAPHEERRSFTGSLFECMEMADSQGHDVTFKMQFYCGILSHVDVLIKGISSGAIRARN